MLVFDLLNDNVHITSTLSIAINELTYTYILQGIIYYADEHFTSLVVDRNCGRWYHDGLRRGGNMVYEGVLDETIDLRVRENKRAIAVFYVLVTAPAASTGCNPGTLA